MRTVYSNEFVVVSEKDITPLNFDGLNDFEKNIFLDSNSVDPESFATDYYPSDEYAIHTLYHSPSGEVYHYAHGYPGENEFGAFYDSNGTLVANVSDGDLNCSEKAYFSNYDSLPLKIPRRKHSTDNIAYGLRDCLFGSDLLELARSSYNKIDHVKTESTTISKTTSFDLYSKVRKQGFRGLLTEYIDGSSETIIVTSEAPYKIVAKYQNGTQASCELGLYPEIHTYEF